MFRMKLFHKFLLVMMLSGILPMLWLGNELISKAKYSLETPINELHIYMAESVKRRFESQFSSFDEKAVLVSAMMAKLDWEGKQASLASAFGMDESIKSISAVTMDGAEVIKAVARSEKNAELKSISREDYFLVMKKTDKKKRIVRLRRDRNLIIILYPLEKFFLKFEIYMDVFFSKLNLGKTGLTGVSMIVDGEGKVVYMPEGFSRDDFGDSPEWKLTQETLKAVSSGSMNYKDEKGGEYMGAFSYLGEMGCAVIVRQDREDAHKFAMDIAGEGGKIVAMFAVLVALLAYFFSRNLSRPIIQITKAADFVAKGDFTHKVNVATGDELKDLAETFNEMTEKLRLYSEMQIDRILREQKNTQAVLYSTEDGIIMVDMKGKIQLINRKAASLMGMDPENSENKDFRESAKTEKTREAIADLMEKRDENYFREFELEQAKVKRVFKAGLKEMVLPDKNEKMGYLIAIYDITLDKELERIKEEFLHSITHDLRNPMGAIKGFVEFMLKEIPGPVNEAQKKMLVSIDRAAFRLLGMINNILDAAKMRAGKMEINLSTFDIREVAARVLDLMESLGQRKKIKFAVDSPREMTVIGDANLLERVFTNLVGNSIKFTPEEGTITIGIRKEERVLRAWVEDTGDGIPLDYIGKVFEKFEQVKGQKAGGTGLGLTISKNVVEAHKGKIWAEYREGKGALFVFTLPLNLAKDEHGRVIVNESGHHQTCGE
ncbi:MAG: hypothetical protein COT17_08500 [Elusimicrobia bacterium CG08_land_8_20_14_0_20_51_18]|nr:MAG: hypothetical protein COT17_08500 [Elusimicrobia bacterium CG08_land_8_20_14_0_20_51_18]